MGCCCSSIMRYILTDRYWRHQEIPTAPHRFFGYGHIFSFTCQHLSLAVVCRNLYNRTPRNSECGIFVLNLPALMIRDYALARALKTEEAMRAFDVFGPPADELLAVSSLSRRIDNRLGFSEYFTQDYLVQTVLIIDDMAMLAIREVDDLFNRRDIILPVDIFPYMSTVAHKIMTLVGLGRDLFTDPDNKPFDLAEIFMPNRGPRFNHTMSPTIDKLFRLRIIPERVKRAFQQAVRNMREVPENELMMDNCLLRELIHYDLLKDEEELGKYLFSFFVEVYITVAVVGTWAFYYMAASTAVQVTLFNAIRMRSIRMPNPPTSSYQSAVDIDYLDAVIMETMRMRPVHGVIPLVCQAESFTMTDSQKKPININRGNLVFASPYGFHMDNLYWGKAQVFVPDRFFAPNLDETTAACFFPYPGLETSKAANFNRLILKRVLFKFYQCYTLDRCPNSKPPKVNFKATVPLPKGEVRVWLSRTDHARDHEAR